MSSRRFLSVCAVPVAGLLAYFTAVPYWPPEQGYSIPKSSPFLAERYAAKPTGEISALMRIAGALAGAGQGDDAGFLRSAWRRLVLKARLGEPAKLPPTVAALVEEERAGPERLERLAGRALEAVRLRVLPAPQDAIWRGAMFADYRLRAEVSNGLAVPVTAIWVRFPREGAGPAEWPMHCRPETPTPQEAERLARARELVREVDAAYPRGSRSGVSYSDAHLRLRRELQSQKGMPLQPGQSAIYVCTGSEHADRAPRDEAALPRPGTTAAAWQVNTPGYTVNNLGALRLGGEPAAQEGAAAAREASCGELAICDQVAQRAWLEVKRHRQQAGFLVCMVLLGCVAWVASRARDVGPPRDAVRSVAATLTTVAWLFALLMVFWSLNPYMGYFSLYTLGYAMVGAGASIALGVALAWLMHRKRASVSRLRVFTAAMALAAPMGATAFLLALGSWGGPVT